MKVGFGSVEMVFGPEPVTVSGSVAMPVPLPLRATSWGEPAALSVKRRIAVRGPGTSGVKVTWTTHDPAGGTAVPEQPSLAIPNEPWSLLTNVALV